MGAWAASERGGVSLAEHFAGRMGQLLGPEFPKHLALAVSGGGDSMAMLALAHDWARVFGVGLWVVTVDHGLRAESGAEAAMVAGECARLGRPHAVLRWHWDGKGNLQDAARRARLDLIDRWRGGIGHVLFAHTRDDVAETFLMRLARGSGVEGLSAMAERRVVRPTPGRRDAIPADDITATAPVPVPSPERQVADAPGFVLVRPLLQVTRADLRHYIDTLKVPHVDDPSNDDPRFDRVRARRALATLGIGADEIAATAQRLGRAAEALWARAAEVAKAVVRQTPHGTLEIDRDGFAAVERDTQLRLLAGALQWIAGQPYRPRAQALEAVLDRALAGGGGTLHGAEVRVNRAAIEVFREYAAVAELVTPAGAGHLWDGRWCLDGPSLDGMEVRALGEQGWQQLPRDDAPDARSSAPAFHIAKALPAVFDGERLVACPVPGFGPDLRFDLAPPGGSFVASLLSR